MISEERLDALWICTVQPEEERSLCLRSKADGDHVTAFARAVEAEAYEAAAKVCEQTEGVFTGESMSSHCAAAIRALKENP